MLLVVLLVSAIPRGALADEPAVTASAAAPVATWGRYPLATSGLYPIWEDTGALLQPAQAQLATSGVRVGILPRLQLGLQPSYYIHRAPNLEAKVSIYSSPRLQLAGRLSAIVLFRDAQDRMITPVYASRVVNPSSVVVLAPTSLHVSWQPWSFLVVHGSATVLPMLSNGEDVANTAASGLSAMIELPIVSGNSLLLHAGEVGLWAHDFAYVGASYRLNYRWFLLQLGYAYRLRAEGAQGSPMLNVGVYL
mgnify:CR=1 FL=1